MFLRIKKQSASLIQINPTQATHRTRTYLKRLLQSKPKETAYLKDTIYQLSPENCQLTHTLVALQKTNNVDPSYAVVAREARLAEDIVCYQLAGYLTLAGGTYRYAPIKRSQYLIYFLQPLDPASMSPNQGRLLNCILHQAYRKDLRDCLYGRGKSYFQLTDEHGVSYLIYLDLLHSVLVREREHYEDELRYEVVGAQLGKGGYAYVYEGIKTLVPMSDGFLEGRVKPRKIKHIYNEHGCTKEKEEQEYHYSKKTSHSHVKRIVRNADEEGGAYMVGRLLPGKTLSRFLDEKMIVPPSVSYRWKLCCSILSAFHDQVALLGIKHRDVSAKNLILSDPSSTFPHFFFIDYAFSEPADLLSDNTCGTPLYAAPEVIDRTGNTTAIDDYALGVVLLKIWNLIHEDEERVPSLSVLRGRMQIRYANLPEFTADLCSDVIDVIGELISDEANKRSQAAETLSRLQPLKIDSLCANQKPAARAAVKMANQQAGALREHFRELFADSHLPEWNPGEISQALENALRPCEDLPLAIEEFLATLGVAAFEQAQGGEQILTMAISLLSDYVKAKSQRLEVKDDLLRVIRGLSLHPDYFQYLMALNQTVSLHETLSPRSFDEMVELTVKTIKDIEALKREVQFIQGADPGLLNKLNPVRPRRCKELPVTLEELVADCLPAVAVSSPRLRK